MCIAIESHESVILRSPFEPPDIEYRDIYWSTLPDRVLSREEQVQSPALDRNSTFPKLHGVDGETDLSFVCRPNCGHMLIDVEICAPFRFESAYPRTHSAYTLSSHWLKWQIGIRPTSFRRSRCFASPANSISTRLVLHFCDKKDNSN